MTRNIVGANNSTFTLAFYGLGNRGYKVMSNLSDVVFKSNVTTYKIEVLISSLLNELENRGFRN